MQRHEDIVLNQIGTPIPGVTITVRVQNATPGSGALATIYSDDGTTLISGSAVTTNTFGRFFFFAPDGKYDLTATGSGITTYTLADIEISDVTESFSSDLGWVVDTQTVGIWNNIRVVDGNKFTTIQAAIDDIPDATGVSDTAPGSGGGLVLVPPGIFAESITLKTNVMVRGYGGSTIIQATGNGVTIVGTPTDGTVTWNTGLENVVIDGNNFTNLIGWDLFNTKVSTFTNLRILRGGASGTAIRMRATTVPTSTNTFRGIKTMSWNVGLHLEGDAAGGMEVTHNDFFQLHLLDCVTTGIDFVSFADTNTFIETRTTIREDGTGVLLNSDAPTLDRDIQWNDFFSLSVGLAAGSNSAETSALKFNRSDRNRFYAFRSSLASPSVNHNFADVNALDNFIDDVSVNANLPFGRGFLMQMPLRINPIDNASPSNSQNIFITGRSSGGALQTSQINWAPNSLQILPASGSNISLRNGLFNDASGFKHARVTTGSVGTGARADVVITWPTAFANANYTPSVSVLETSAAGTGIIVERIRAKIAASITVQVLNESGGALTGTLQAIAVHD